MFEQVLFALKVVAFMLVVFDVALTVIVLWEAMWGGDDD